MLINLFYALDRFPKALFHLQKQAQLTKITLLVGGLRQWKAQLHRQ